MKHTASERIIEIVRRVHEGRDLESVATGPGIDKKQERTVALSSREEEVCALALRGYKNREIAGKLSISEHTVKNHLHSAYTKYRVSDRVDLARQVLDKGRRLHND
jgi:DNA-binding NarL/FixJ family response regulator